MKLFANICLTTNKYQADGAGIGTAGYTCKDCGEGNFLVQFIEKTTGVKTKTLVVNETEMELTGREPFGFNDYDLVRLTTNKYQHLGLYKGDYGDILADFDEGNFEVHFSEISTAETVHTLILNPPEMELYNVNDPVPDRPGTFPINPYEDVICNNIDLDDVKTVVAIYWWSLGLGNSIINFRVDGRYSLGYRPYDGYFAFGDYEVSGNNVLVRYPYEILRVEDASTRTWPDEIRRSFYGGISIYEDAANFHEPAAILDWLFEGKNDSLLVYDKTHETYSRITCLGYERETYEVRPRITCLRYGNKIIKNVALINPSPSATALECLSNRANIPSWEWK
jgi:hypothetical protein